MRSGRTTLLVVLAAVLSTAAHAQEVSSRDREVPAYLTREESIAVSLYQAVLPAVVTVYAETDLISTSGGEEIHETLASGVLISPARHVLTAAHVVDAADRIHVKTQDGRLRPAKLVRTEGHSDLALLELDEHDKALSYARLGDSDRLAVGQATYIIGSPFGFENSFSVGRISAFRELDSFTGEERVEFIQTDAAINSGNSGGPVFNSRGEVIGVASRMFTVSGGSQGVNFVVPINTAKARLELSERLQAAPTQARRPD